LTINPNYLIINYLVLYINIAYVSQYSINCKKNELKDMISIKSKVIRMNYCLDYTKYIVYLQS